MLDFEQLKGMTRQDALAWADKHAGVAPGTMDGIWRTETSRGEHPTLVGPATKWGTAKGHFQALDSTHAAIEKRVGRPLNRFDFTESLVGAAELMRENRAREGNDDDAIKAYHGGPNRKQWGEKTADYLMKVTGRAGNTAPATKRSARAVDPETGEVDTVARPAAELWRMSAQDVASMERPDPKLEAFTRTQSIAPVGSNVEAQGAVEATRQRGEALTKEIRDTPFLGLYDRSSTLGAAYNRTMSGTFRLADLMLGDAPDNTPDPEWIDTVSADPGKYLQGFTAEEQTRIIENLSSKDAYEAMVHRLAEERQDNLILQRGGTLKAGTAMLMSGALDPTTWATGVGAAKAFAAAGIGATALAAQGRVGAAATSLFAENALGNMSYEAFQQAMGEHKSVGDYALAGAIGILPTALGYRGLARDAAAAFQAKVLREQVETQARVMKEASENLGPNATTDEIVAEASRLEAVKIREEAARRKAGVPEEDRFNAPDLDDMKPETAGSADSRLDVPVQENWADPTFQQRREDAMLMREDWQENARTVLDGELGFEDIRAKAGVTMTRAAQEAIPANVTTAIKELAAEYLPGAKIGVGTKTLAEGSDGVAVSIKDTHIIGIQPRPGSPNGMMHTAIHELGHAVVHQHAPNVPPAVWKAVDAEYQTFIADLAAGRLDDAVAKRFATTSPNRMVDKLMPTKYAVSRDEYLAEQFVKHVQKRAADNELGWPKQVVASIVNAVKAAMDYVLGAARKGYVKPGEASERMFRDILNGVADQGQKAEEFLAPELQFGSFAQSVKQPDPLDVKHGLDLMKDTTPRERMEKKYIREIYRKAEEWLARNPINEEALKTLADNKFFNFATPATLLLKSENPVARMVAGILMEHTMGAAGRRVTAGIASVQINREFIGNTLLKFDNAYTAWRNGKVGLIKGATNDMFARTLRDQFDREVMLYREALLMGETPAVDPMVKAASESLTESYERMLHGQKEAKVPGWANLPDNSKGYVPHVLAADKVMAASDGQLRAYQAALKQQLMELEGMDDSFADKIAKQYLDHARINANGGHEIPANVYDPNAADYVRQSLKAMGLSEEEVSEFANRLAAGGARHTKSRMRLDLNRVYDVDGSPFQLVDLFQHDQVALLRTYARRASGDVALSNAGIAGSAGLRLIERALQFGETRLAPEQMKAFHQFSAEILGRPFGDHTPQFLDNALSLTASANLGGMGIMQVAETINIATGIGIKNTMEAIASGPRLMGEVFALARGEKVENSILGSMELPGGGGEFGLDGYKMVTAYDSPSNVIDTYGRDAAGAGTRLIRAAGHSMRALTGQRLVHAVQTRGVAEQITLKALIAIRDGKGTKVLADMGFTDDLIQRLQPELATASVWSGGRVKEFDITKLSPDAGREFAIAVRRGTAQLVQEALPGERMALQHSSWGKVLTQFRAFPMLAMEKQWGRNRVMHGPMVAAMMVVAGAGAALPVYLARVALNAQGRPDKDEYIEKMTQPLAMARATLNYVGMAGMLGDVLDAVSAVANDVGVMESENLRTGRKHSIDSVVPLAGYAGRVLNLPSQWDNPHEAIRVLPASNTPLMIPVVNWMRPE